MREIEIDLLNLQPQYECGNVGEANATTLKINISSIKDNATHFIVVLKNSFSEIFCSEKIGLASITDSKIELPLWQSLTKTGKEILVVEAYKVNEEDNIEFLRKSPVINLHFESSVSSDEALEFDKEIYGLFKELHNLENSITQSITDAQTATKTAVDTTNNIIELKNSGAFNGPQGEQGPQGEPGTTNYINLESKPSINDIILEGNKTFADLGLDITNLKAIYIVNDENESQYTDPEGEFRSKLKDEEYYITINPNHLDKTTSLVFPQILYVPSSLFEISDLSHLEQFMQIILLLGQEIDNKVSKEDGKGLSSNDFTTDEKNKLAKAVTTDGTNNLSGTYKLSGTINVGDYGGKIIVNPPTTYGDVANKSYVDESINKALSSIDAMTFKGTLGDGGTITSLPTQSAKNGDTYKIITAGIYAGQKCEIGDLIIATRDGSTIDPLKDADWVVVQSNIDGAVTADFMPENINKLPVIGAGNSLMASSVSLEDIFSKLPRWEKIASITLNEEVSSVEITQDMEGSCFELSEFILLARIKGSETTTKNRQMKVYVADNVYITPTYVPFSIPSGNNQSSVVTYKYLDRNNGYIDWESQKSDTPRPNGSDVHGKGIAYSVPEKINKIIINSDAVSEGACAGVGSMFEIWGR